MVIVAILGLIAIFIGAGIIATIFTKNNTSKNLKIILTCLSIVLIIGGMVLLFFGWDSVHI